MRRIEILVSAANLLAFLALAAPRLHALRWTGYAALVALLLAIAQALVEGPRWQMAPAYALSVLLFFAWLPRSAAPAAGPAANALLVGLAAGLAFAIALPLVLPVFRFPHPSGPYQVGTLTYHWVDADRPEIFAADANARRELMVQIWYPAKGDPAAPRAPYLPDADALTAAFARVHRRPEFLFGNLKHITSDAIPSAQAADDEPSYPVLIFLEGLTGFRQMNTFQVEELVSHGYVVAAIDQRYTAASVVFPDGRRVAVLPIDQIQPAG